VKPDSFNPSCCGLPDQIRGDGWVRDQHEPADDSRYGGQIGIARYAFEMIRVRVDRNGLEASVKETAEDGVGRLIASARNTSNGDTLAREEPGYSRWKGMHAASAIRARCPLSGVSD